MSINAQALYRSTREQLEVWADNGELYALLDSFFQIPLPLEKIRLETKDTDPVFYELIAWDQVTYEPPSLVKLSRTALEWILNSLSTERWGLFFASKAQNVTELARHFQKFVIAKGPDSNPYFLRFHDAAVLEVLLRTWTEEEKRIFFGPAMAFGLPDLDTMEISLIWNSEKDEGVYPKPEDCLIQLKQTQLKLCGEAIDRDLVRVIYWHLRNHHARPVQFLDRPTLEARIQVSISRARGYGLGTISDLAGFAALMFELAPNFDEHPSFRRILEDPSLPSEVKMRKLSQVISDRDWNEAISLYDRSYWNLRKTRKRKP
ncbi:MAG TPA: DUF4123 domain-containing protein [Bdellovibrionales bacterium]|nr:DUF4123 domain-containing protein [Bdellovibrionales bacterium]